MGLRVHVFGPFEYERSGAARVLRKHGIRLKLQGQPLEILEALIEQQGRVVTRQQLQERLWGAETFVDFDRGLNTAVKRLRAALGDSADEPRYIETIARTGYVFIAPVSELIREPEAVPAPPLISAPAGIALPVATAPNRRRWLWAAGGAVAASVGGLGYIARPRGREVKLQRLSFGDGAIRNAFFTRDRKSIVYSARWTGETWKTYLHRLGSSHHEPLRLEGYGVASISDNDELVLFAYDPKLTRYGAIVRAELSGGAPQYIDERIKSVDWALDGKHIACVRGDDKEDQVEYPAGRVMHSTHGSLGPVRVSPTDGAVAVIEHPVRGDSGGYILVLKRNRTPRKLIERWPHIAGIGWHPSGQEVWFTGSRDGSTTALWAVDRAGNTRMVGLPGMADASFDIHRNGSVAFIKTAARVESELALDGEIATRPLVHLGWTRLAAISDGGSVALFDESNEAVQNRFRAFVYRRDTRKIQDIGPGGAQSISRDGKTALILDQDNRRQLFLVNTLTGQRTALPDRDLVYEVAALFPDGEHLLVTARWKDRMNAVPFLAVHPIWGGAIDVLPFSEGFGNARVGPGGKFIAAGRGIIMRWDKWDEAPKPVKVDATCNLIGFDEEGRYIVRAASREPAPGDASLFVVIDGRLQAMPRWTLSPSNRRGAGPVAAAIISTDGKSAGFWHRRNAAELYLAEGLS
jgi:DNA-binding winged helix-turn-helix (wHTH) protein